MHSSRMRTGRALTVFRSLLLPGGGCLLWMGVCSGGGYLPGSEGVPAWSWGVSGPGGGTCLVPRGGVPGQVLPPPL